MLLLWLAWSPRVVCWAFFNQIEIGRVRWEIQQRYSQPFGCFDDCPSVIVGRIVEHYQQPLAWVGGPYLIMYCRPSKSNRFTATPIAPPFPRCGSERHPVISSFNSTVVFCPSGINVLPYMPRIRLA